MGQDTLTAKLNELQRQYGKMISFISLTDNHSLNQLEREITEAKRVYMKNRQCLSDKMLYSKSRASSEIAELYEHIDRKFQEVKDEVVCFHSRGKSDVEERILFAEYALDFAAISVYQALILSMEAIYADKKQVMEGEKIYEKENRK
jgi:hypothetical protein